MTTINTLDSGDIVRSTGVTEMNTNFENLNNDKVENIENLPVVETVDDDWFFLVEDSLWNWKKIKKSTIKENLQQKLYNNGVELIKRNYIEFTGNIVVSLSEDWETLNIEKT